MSRPLLPLELLYGGTGCAGLIGHVKQARLGRLCDAAVAAFDRQVFDLYALSAEDLLVIRSA